MTTISHAVGSAEVRGGASSSRAQLRAGRARTFLTLVVLIHHSVIPYTYFGHTDPKSWIGFDCVVLATDSFFMAMFFLLSGLFVWPGLARKGSPGPARSPGQARPALRDLRVYDHSDGLLRRSRCATRRTSALPTSGGKPSPSDPGRADRSGSSGCCWRSTWSQPSSTGCHPACSIRSIDCRCAAVDQPGSILHRFACCHRRPLHSRARLLRSRQLVRIRAVLGPGGRVLLYATYFFFGAGIGAADTWIAGCWLLTASWRSSSSAWMIRALVPYCLHVGADLHQARNSGESGAAAGLV